MKKRCQFCGRFSEGVPAEMVDKHKVCLRCEICGNRIGFVQRKKLKKEVGDKDGKEAVV